MHTYLYYFALSVLTCRFQSTDWESVGFNYPVFRRFGSGFGSWLFR